MGRRQADIDLIAELEREVRLLQTEAQLQRETIRQQLELNQSLQNQVDILNLLLHSDDDGDEICYPATLDETE
jgi:hypothetical protein